MMFVMTLSGSSIGVRDLARSSHIKSKAAPTKAVAGTSFLLSNPTSNLAMCGLTTPIQAIIPATEVAEAVPKVAKKIPRLLHFLTSNPKAFASSSPRERTLKIHLM